MTTASTRTQVISYSIEVKPVSATQASAPLAESVIGLFKTEVIRSRGPWHGFKDVEHSTLEWIVWFNTQRLMEPLSILPPAKYEEQFHHAQAAQTVALALA